MWQAASTFLISSTDFYLRCFFTSSFLFKGNGHPLSVKNDRLFLWNFWEPGFNGRLPLVQHQGGQMAWWMSSASCGRGLACCSGLCSEAMLCLGKVRWLINPNDETSQCQGNFAQIGQSKSFDSQIPLLKTIVSIGNHVLYLSWSIYMLKIF